MAAPPLPLPQAQLPGALPLPPPLPLRNTLCSVCLEDPWALPATLPCGHSFCTRCIRRWLDTSRSCPVCRARVSWRVSIAPDAALVLLARTLHGATVAEETAAEAARDAAEAAELAAYSSAVRTVVHDLLLSSGGEELSVDDAEAALPAHLQRGTRSLKRALRSAPVMFSFCEGGCHVGLHHFAAGAAGL